MIVVSVPSATNDTYKSILGNTGLNLDLLTNYQADGETKVENFFNNSAEGTIEYFITCDEICILSSKEVIVNNPIFKDVISIGENNYFLTHIGNVFNPYKPDVY